MHQANRYTESGGRRQGILGFKGANVIDHLRTGATTASRMTICLAGINRNRDIELSRVRRSITGITRLEFFIDRYPGSAGTGRFPADIENIRAFSNHFQPRDETAAGQRHMKLAAIGKMNRASR